MSRVTGLLLPDVAARTPLHEAMMRSLCAGPRWNCHARSAGPVSLGWCGWRTPTIATRGHVDVTLDGWVFNRHELGAADNDAALVAALYEQHGFADALAKLNGDFAVALYDRASDTLWLGRDRLGIRPLYYCSTPQLFAFASQPRALLQLPGVSDEENRRFVALFAAAHYRYFDNAPEESPYAAIAQLPAAQVLRWRNGVVARSTYWAFEDWPEIAGSEAELAERYRDLLIDAVGLRLKAALRPIFTLSGGMDSSSVLASAVKLTGVKQAAVSAVYDDPTYDESDEARTMIDPAVSTWHQVRVGNPDVFDEVARIVAIQDEPVATATWLSHYVLCQQMSARGYGGLFGGLGGDELNAGEYEHFFPHFADLRAAGDEGRLRREVEMWIHYHNHPTFKKDFQVVESAFRELVDLGHPGRCLPDRKRLRRYFGALDHGYFDLERFEPVMEHPFGSYLKNRTYQDLTRETVPCCLRAEDRHTTAAGLDNFLPFLDHRLVEFMFRMPGTLKFRDGVTKHLLREAMRGVLPEETRTRVKKTGWNAPAHIWFAGPMRARLMDLLHSRAFAERGVYNVAEVQRLADEHLRIVEGGVTVDNHMMFFWQLVNLETWLAANRRRASAGALSD
jgi:asparagine synthase (glutamine-hydrolysing)